MRPLSPSSDRGSKLIFDDGSNVNSFKKKKEEEEEEEEKKN